MAKVVVQGLQRGLEDAKTKKTSVRPFLKHDNTILGLGMLYFPVDPASKTSSIVVLR